MVDRFARTRGRSDRGVVSVNPDDAPALSFALAQSESGSALLISVPNLDDAGAPIPDGIATTTGGRARRDDRRRRPRRTPNPGDLGSIRDDARATIRRGATHDARQNHRVRAVVPVVPLPAQPRKVPSVPRRRMLFEVSFLVPPREKGSG